MNNSRFEDLIINITVIHKNIAFPLDGELYDKAHKCGLQPRRTYTKLAMGLLGKACRLGRGRKFKQKNCSR